MHPPCSDFTPSDWRCPQNRGKPSDGRPKRLLQDSDALRQEHRVEGVAKAISGLGQTRLGDPWNAGAPTGFKGTGTLQNIDEVLEVHWLTRVVPLCGT